MKLPKWLRHITLSTLLISNLSGCLMATTPEKPTEPREKFSLTKTSDEEGKVWFYYDWTIRYLIDKDTKEPIPNTQLTYEKDPDYKIFFSPGNEEYLPIMDPSEEETDTIFLTKKENAPYLETTTPHNVRKFWYWMEDRKVNSVENWQKTINRDELLLEEFNGIQTFAQWGSSLVIATNSSSEKTLEEVFDEISWCPQEEFQRFDIYQKEIENTSFQLIIPTYPPWVESGHPEVQGHNVYLEFLPQDQITHYHIPSYVSQLDPTIKLPPTLNPDLSTEARLIPLVTGIPEDWKKQESPYTTSLPSGPYKLEIKVEDEVGNKGLRETYFLVEN